MKKWVSAVVATAAVLAAVLAFNAVRLDSRQIDVPRNDEAASCVSCGTLFKSRSAEHGDMLHAGLARKTCAIGNVGGPIGYLSPSMFVALNSSGVLMFLKA